MPLVTVFRVGADLLLADGFHRYHAHRALEATGIAAEVIDGSRQDALRFSLAANAKHGKQRNSRDLARAYDIACTTGWLIRPTAMRWRRSSDAMALPPIV
jgi:hypothetical protein